MRKLPLIMTWNIKSLSIFAVQAIMNSDLEKLGKLPIPLKLAQRKNISDPKRVTKKVFFVKAYNGLSVCNPHHSPISRIVDYSKFYDEQ